MDRARVTLRPAVEGDLELLVRLYSRQVSAPFNWSGHRSAAVVARRLEKDGLVSPDDGTLIVVLEDGTAVGSVGWRAVDHGAPPSSRCWNIGITLVPEHRGRGIGAEAQRLLAEDLLSTTTVNRIEADTDVSNVAEQRALSKAGFRREGVLRGAQFRDGRWNDLVMFSRLRQD